MNFNRTEKTGLAILFLLTLSLGWMGHMAYIDYNNKVEIKGLWLKAFNESNAKNYAKNMDSSGQWVCININEHLSFDSIVETCKHEAGHELFARKCTANPETCFKAMEALENE